MDPEKDYLDINRALWDAKTNIHVTSAFYHMDDGSFLRGRSSLNDIELRLLGDVTGKEILHLQCHFGQDTLSLARMAASVTGVDFSAEAIRVARELNNKLGLSADFLCTDVYSLPGVLVKKYDMVFASYGTIGWLPDMKRWAAVVAGSLRPGGRFVFVEFHPVVWMFDYEFTGVAYSYFNSGAIVETQTGTYAGKDADIKQTEIGWNHGLAEVIQCLTDEGLRIEVFSEYDYSPYDCFKNMVGVAEGKFMIRGLEGKLPLVYAIVAVKGE